MNLFKIGNARNKIYIVYPPGSNCEYCNFVLRTNVEPKIGDIVVLKEDAILITGILMGVAKAVGSGDMISLDDARKRYRESLSGTTK